MRGLYALLISVDRKATVAVGGLGDVRLRRGVHVYLGSGRGTGSASIEGRLTRHFRHGKRRHWHIDYLLSNRYCKPELAFFSYARGRLECRLAAEISRDPRAGIVYRGFGSSDCSCSGHLILLGFERAAAELLVYEKFIGLGLEPWRWPG
ncbi:GIY-YIG nuclease family protein [Candidatus Bathyarchaeota archaeon]|nr:GIY-YIG nuclease family protein [Candidatus Bathyarchaeota archaeon]